MPSDLAPSPNRAEREPGAKAPRLDHVLMVVADAPSTLRFLTEVVGLRVGERPPFGMAGWWLYAGPDAVVHMVQREPAARLGARTDTIDHVAFRLTGPDATRARLSRGGWPFGEAIVPKTGELQLFIALPGGPRIELVFDAPAADAS